MNNKVKQVLRAIAGFILLPIFIAIFMCDRFILIFLFWMESKRLKSLVGQHRNVYVFNVKGIYLHCGCIRYINWFKCGYSKNH